MAVVRKERQHLKVTLMSRPKLIPSVMTKTATHLSSTKPIVGGLSFNRSFHTSSISSGTTGPTSLFGLELTLTVSWCMNVLLNLSI